MVKYNMFKSLLKNKIIIYLLTRYVTYALQFIVSIVIASQLGPFYLGVYGFLMLILNYFTQINFGIPHSLNVLLVHNKLDKGKCNNYVGNSFAIYGIMSIFVLGIFLWIILSNASVSKKYPVTNIHYLLICVIVILQYFSSLCSTVLRVKNKVNQLAFAQSTLVFFNLLVVFIFNEENLIYVLLICQLVSWIIYLYISKKENILPEFGEVKYCVKTQKEIVYKGFYLFLYNSCFYFILISIRTLISWNYSVEEFGIFNFSYTLAHAVLLLIEALTMIIFPKIIDLLSSKDYAKIDRTIENIRMLFVSTSHLLIYIALLCFPLVVMLVPKFEGALTSINLIALAILMNTNSYGYSSFLIAQNKEKISARISFIALIINILVAGILTMVFHVQFSYVILAVVLTYFCFSLMAVMESKKIMGTLAIKSVLGNFFPFRLFIPYVVAVFVSLKEQQNLMFIPLLLFIFLNLKDIKYIITFSQKIIKNPNIADI